MTLPNVYTCGEAIYVALELSDKLKEYGSLSVVDLYDYMKRDNPKIETSHLTYKDNMIGWTYDDSNEIRFRKVVGGVQIVFPEPHSFVM